MNRKDKRKAAAVMRGVSRAKARLELAMQLIETVSPSSKRAKKRVKEEIARFGSVEVNERLRQAARK